MKVNIIQFTLKLGEHLKSAWNHEWSIRSRLLLLVLLPATAIAFALSFYFTSTQLDDLENSLQTRAKLLTNQLAKSISHYSLSRQQARIKELLVNALAEKDVIAIRISNTKKSTLINLSNPTDSQTRARAPFVYQAAIIKTLKVPSRARGKNLNPGKTVGWVTAQFSYKSTLARGNVITLEGYLIAFIGLLLSSLLAMRMGKNVTEPIIRLTETVKDMAEGKLDTRVSEQSRGELGTLEQDVNTMGSALQETQQYLNSKIDSATLHLRSALTEMELQNEELDKARQQAMDASLIKTEFLANIGHEIRTPLNAILGFTNLLLKSDLNHTQQDQLATIDQSTRSLLTVINDTLDFSRIEAGDFRMENVSYDLREVLEDAVTLMTQQAYDKGLDLVLMIYTDVPHRLISDPVRIRQIVTSLVSNAIKFTDKGSITIRVMLEEDTKKEVILKVSVQDTGAGMTAQQQDHLFDPYVQSSSPGEGVYSNVRLGLVICKKLIESMEGQIGTESELNKGSTFWFTYKAKIDKSKKYEQHGDNALQQFECLFYDSNELSRLAIVHQMSDWGIDINEASNLKTIETTIKSGKKNKAKSSSRKKAARQPDLVIVALTKAELESDVFGKLMKTCKLKNKSNIPVLVMASSVSKTVLNHLQEQGATLAIPKTLRAQQLYDKVGLLLTHTAEEQPATESKTISSRTGNTSNKNLTGLNTLIVDDNKINRKLIQALLEEQGAHIFEASDGKQAVELFTSQHIDFIVMDIQMPVMTGLEATRKIRSMEQGRQRTPIIALTANMLDGDQERFVRAGFDDFLLKPVQDNALFGLINKWLLPSGFKTSIETISVEKPPPPVKKQSSKRTEPLSTMFDRKQALRLTGGNMELAAELFDMFVEDLPNMKTVLNQTLNPLDYEQLESIAHKIQGAASYCAVNIIRESAGAAEKAAHRHNDAEMYKQVKQLNKDIDSLLKEQAALSGKSESEPKKTTKPIDADATTGLSD